ncbi:hypothetical protein RYZ26_11165 [Terasakiella sp. A23]|uniref:hypothetical protein n=1 Tax=Terasakiella sp. FCG-A23 TaxID=3080561 RepID=UPI002953D1BB|nr:hypothetical protein [Terasakiella sp. A23]MDV7340156.1 hypothetical protein [Terasakiella sp. A23]
MHIIRLALSIDHQKKKAMSVHLPFPLYLHFVTSAVFEKILPEDLKEKYHKAKDKFLSENKFFSEEYEKEYVRSPYIRLICGPDIHKFFGKVLSLNYQTHQNLLKENAGSFAEFFADLDLFWNEKYRKTGGQLDERALREVAFCQACLQTQYQRMTEKQVLRDKLGDFAKQEIKDCEDEIKRLKQALSEAKNDRDVAQAELERLQAELHKTQEANLVLVPSDPHYMLGLKEGYPDEVEKRAKTLMKALHPDKTGSADTAYLFDLIVKSRDMILK